MSVADFSARPPARPGSVAAACGLFCVPSSLPPSLPRVHTPVRACVRACVRRGLAGCCRYTNALRSTMSRAQLSFLNVDLRFSPPTDCVSGMMSYPNFGGRLARGRSGSLPCLVLPTDTPRGLSVCLSVIVLKRTTHLSVHVVVLQ
jgi:hypothetical protein